MRADRDFDRIFTKIGTLIKKRAHISLRPKNLPDGAVGYHLMYQDIWYIFDIILVV